MGEVERAAGWRSAALIELPAWLKLPNSENGGLRHPMVKIGEDYFFVDEKDGVLRKFGQTWVRRPIKDADGLPRL